MIFRKQGKLVEICRTDYKTDEMYYNEIYKLYKETNKQGNNINFNKTNTATYTTNTNTYSSISPLVSTLQNLLLKNHSIQ